MSFHLVSFYEEVKLFRVVLIFFFKILEKSFINFMAAKPQGFRLQITLVWQDLLPRKRVFFANKNIRKQNIVCPILSKDLCLSQQKF